MGSTERTRKRDLVYLDITRFDDRSFPAAGPRMWNTCRRNCDGQTLSLANSVDY